jgi:hypothetical protein
MLHGWLVMLPQVKRQLNESCNTHVKKHVKTDGSKYETKSSTVYPAGYILATGCVIKDLALLTRSHLPPDGISLNLIRSKVAA